MRAGYMNITNNGSRNIAIESIASESFARIEIHQSFEKAGMMTMRAVHTLSIPPRKSVRLKPGGFHQMMDPLRELSPGDKISVSLQPDDQTSQSITMIVRK